MHPKWRAVYNRLDCGEIDNRTPVVVNVVPVAIPVSGCDAPDIRPKDIARSLAASLNAMSDLVDACHALLDAIEGHAPFDVEPFQAAVAAAAQARAGWPVTSAPLYDAMRADPEIRAGLDAIGRVIDEPEAT